MFGLHDDGFLGREGGSVVIPYFTCDCGLASGEEKECPRFASYPQYSGFVLVVLKLSIPAGEIM